MQCGSNAYVYTTTRPHSTSSSSGAAPVASVTSLTHTCAYLSPQHAMQAHDVGVTWMDCGEVGCSKRFKTRGNLKQHLLQLHGIGVVWLDCPDLHCTRKFKTPGNLRKHLAGGHRDLMAQGKSRCCSVCS